MATLLNPFIRAMDANGDPVSGGKLAVFLAGTSTAVTTYSDRALTSAQAQPLIANSAGEFAQSFVAAGVYKIRVRDADDNTLYENDNVRIADRPDDPAPLDDEAAVLADTATYTTGAYIRTTLEGYTFEAAASGATDHDETNAGGQKLYRKWQPYDTPATLIAAEESARGEDAQWLTRDGHNYKEAASGATDHHLTTAGGVKLYVLPVADGWVAEAFDDGVLGFEVVWQKAVDACKAAGGGRVTLSENHTISDTIKVWGDFGYDGIQIDGTNVEITSTHTGPAIEFVPDARPDGGDAAPQLKQRSEIKGITFNGPGKAVSGSSAVLVRNGGAVTAIRCKVRGYETAYKGYGGLILRYHECEAYGNGQAIDFDYDGTFAPNDIHFNECKLFENDRIGEISDFPNGAVTFNNCEMEGNNAGGNNADGVTVLELDNAGVVNLIGSHMEVNPGEEHILFAGGAAHSALNIIGGQVIPGNNNFAAVHMSNANGSYGHLHVVGARVTNAATNQIYMDTGTSALIEGDTAGNVQGDLSQVAMIRKGKYTQGATNVPANAGMRSKGSASIAHDFEGQARFVNAANTRLGYINNSGAAFGFINDNDNEGIQFNTKISGGSAARFYIARSGALTVEPAASGTISLGSAIFRWSEVFASNGTINTSDEREKEQIGAIPDKWLDAWGDVEWSRFKWRDAVSEKGGEARWHVGLVAQQVRDAFAARGLSALEIGLLCYDQWEDQWDKDEGGNLVLIAQAGERYGIRYDQAQALEAAFVRRAISRRKS